MCLGSLILWYKMTKKDNLVSTVLVLWILPKQKQSAFSSFASSSCHRLCHLIVGILSSSLSSHRHLLSLSPSSHLHLMVIFIILSHHHCVNDIIIVSSSCHYRLHHLVVVSLLYLKEIHMWVFLGRGGQQPPGTKLPLFFPSWEHVLHMLCHSQRPRYQRYLWSCLWDDGGWHVCAFLCSCFCTSVHVHSTYPLY